MHISYWSSDVCSSDLVLAIAPIIRDGENRLDADFLAGDKVLFTMIGRHVDKARTGVRSDMLGSDEGAGLGEEAPEFVHRMASNRSGQIRAFARPDNMVIGDGEISASGQSREQDFGEKNSCGWPRRRNRTDRKRSG